MQWGGKKVWPYFRDVARVPGFNSIPKMDSLQDLVRVIRGASTVVCAEGLISHIAAAVGTRAVVIYGGFLKPEWNGYSSQTNIVSNSCKISCYNNSPCQYGQICMKSISIEEVISCV
jgi:ADP-heptose:LPS heptosyltransferase